MSGPTTAVALCADDYGQHLGIDDAVCELLAKARLSAVSCMSAAPRWASHSAPRLRELATVDGCADLGLHLDLTEPDGPFGASLAALIARSYTGSIDRQALRSTLARQFDAFESGLGRAPEFIDGHRHVHQLAPVADALMELIERRYGARKPWVRNTMPARGLAFTRWKPKQAILKLLGGAALERRLKAGAIPTNAGFGGVYGFDTDDYARHFDQWLSEARNGTLLMCHPAASTCEHDPIGRQRLVEYGFFSSAAFARMLAEHRIRLARMSLLLQQA